MWGEGGLNRFYGIPTSSSASVMARKQLQDYNRHVQMHVFLKTTGFSMTYNTGTERNNHQKICHVKRDIAKPTKSYAQSCMYTCTFKKMGNPAFFTTPYATSFRRFFAYHHAVNNSHTYNMQIGIAYGRASPSNLMPSFRVYT